MAQAQGKSISELGTAAIYMSPDDLALISEKQTNGSFKSKAVKKEAFEKLTIAGDRDAEARSAASYKTISFLDNSSAHLGAGYIQQAFWAGGQNATSILARKKCGSTTVDGVLAMVVNPNGSRYGYCTAEGFGVGPQPTSASGANVYIQGSNGSVELRPPQTANHGGYIDFHYNGSTVNYTSRLIESSELQLVSTDKNVVVKTAGSGKSVILNAPANNSILQNAPTAADDAKTSKAIATVGWVASKFLPQSAFIDPSGDIQDATDMIEALAGLLNKQDLIIYVDSTSTLEASGSYVLKSIDSKNKGIFLAKDATKQTPVKSIYDAIAIARKIKFLEDAQCHIRILDDQTFQKQSSTTRRMIDFSHPDLVQNKAFYVYGWNGGSSYNASKHEYTGLGGSYALRKISIDLSSPTTTLDNKYYMTLISTRSKVTFKYIVFNGMLGMTHFNDGSRFSLKSDYARSSYFVYNCGNDQIRFERCMFRGCDVAFCGPNGYFTDCAFSFVQTCIEGLAGNRIDVYLGINVNNCYRFISAEFASFVYVSVGATPCKWKIYTSTTPIQASTAGNAIVAAYHPLVDIAVVEDSTGTIIIDGEKYKRAPSAQEATKVNTNIAAFDVARIAPSSATAVTATKKVVDGADSASVKAFVKDFTGRETLGYGPGGYIDFGYGHAHWLDLFSHTTAGWADNEIPNAGTISF